MNVVFLGPPGSGKGTMASRMAKRCNLLHLSTGDMLRAEIKQGTELGNLAKSFIDKGALVPDSVIIDMMSNRFLEEDAKNGVLLDGFPRTTAQAEALESIANIDSCINLVVAAEVVVNRVASRRVCANCGEVYSIKTYAKSDCEKCAGELTIRPDDNEKTIRARFAVYEEQTAPLIEYYTDKGILESVDATMPIEEEAEYIYGILSKI